MSEIHGAIILVLGMIIVSATAGMLVTGQLIKTRDRADHISEEQIASSVGNGVKIMEIYARSVSPRTFDYLYVKSKLLYSSDPLPIGTLLVDFNSGENYSTYTYDGEIDCDLSPEPNDPNTTGQLSDEDYSQKYGIKFLHREGDSLTDYIIEDGDIVNICFKSSSRVGDADHVSIAIYPENAAVKTESFRTPDVLKGTYFKIYPPIDTVY